MNFISYHCPGYAGTLEALTRIEVGSRLFSHWLPSKSTLTKTNTVKLKKKSAYGKIKRKWTKTGLPFYRGWLRSRSDLG